MNNCNMHNFYYDWWGWYSYVSKSILEMFLKIRLFYKNSKHQFLKLENIKLTKNMIFFSFYSLKYPLNKKIYIKIRLKIVYKIL